MKLDFSMAKAGDKYIGELEFQRPDGEYDVWTIVKRLDPAVAGSSPKGYPIYLIGTTTNSGLLSDYYYKPERGESESKSLDEINADLEVLAQDGESYMSRVKRIPKKGLKKNPPFYAHNLYEKKTHGLNLKQMRRLYAMVSRGNQKAITYARNVLGIPFSESPSQVKAVVLHHVRDLAERRVRRNPFRSGGYLRETPKEAGYKVISLKGRQLILEDLADGKRELWARSPHHAGYAIFYKNNTYEFVTSVLPGMTPVLPRAGQPILGNRKKQAIVIDIYDYTYEAGKGGGGLMMFHGGGREGSGYFKSRDQMEKMIGLLRRSFKISAIRDRRTWK